MQIDATVIEQTIQSMVRRSDAARNAGGISKIDHMEGAKIPDGWKLDMDIDYWLPPNITLI